MVLDKTRRVSEAQVYLCESQLETYFMDGVAAWYDPDDVKKFRCSGMEPTTLSQRNNSTHGEIPVKFISPNSLVALEVGRLHTSIPRRESGRAAIVFN